LSAAQLIRTARRNAQLTQGELGRRANIDQSRISKAEAGNQVPTFDSVERLLRSAGCRLISVPTTRDDAATIGAAIRDAIQDGLDARAVRLFIQLSDNLVAEHGAVRFALTLSEPEKTGLKHWDAALAALVEYRLNEERLPIPEWVQSSARFLGKSWTLGAGPYTFTPDVARVPQEFLRRRVLADRDTLVSV
jgi:transcriptional regulator with XRE-family HTH domain